MFFPDLGLFTSSELEVLNLPLKNVKLSTVVVYMKTVDSGPLTGHTQFGDYLGQTPTGCTSGVGILT